VAEATVYWRPGCPFCFRLRWGLRLTRTPHRLVNIWEQPWAAAVVREHNGGDELVPTVDVGGRLMSNPSLRTVRRAVAQAA
jgi:mycoredoxin